MAEELFEERRFRTGVFGARTNAVTAVPRTASSVDARASSQGEGLLGEDLSSLVKGFFDNLRSGVETLRDKPEAPGIEEIPGILGNIYGGLAEGLNQIAPPTGGIPGLFERPESADSADAGGRTPQRQPSGAEVESARAQQEASLTLLEQIQFAASGENLDPLTVEQLREVEQQLAASITETQQLIDQAERHVEVQDALFEFQAAQLGLDPDVASLSEAIDAEGGVGAQTVEAIMATLADESLTHGQKQDIIDLLSDRMQFGGQVVAEVETLVAQEQNLTEILESGRALDFVDRVAYLHPTFVNSLEFDPAERFFSNAILKFDEFFPDFDGSSDEASRALNNGLAAAASGALIEGHESVKTLARLMQVPSGSVVEALEAAVLRGQESELALQDSLDADVLVPGDEALMYAAQQAAMEAGWPPQLAQLFANSMGLHGIIQQVSAGRVGFVGEGTIRGIGGLTEDMYSIFMGEEWTPNRGAAWELEALARWVAEAFNGEITEAIEYYYRTGEWGGTSSLAQIGSS
jgi:hypothetical protein